LSAVPASHCVRSCEVIRGLAVPRVHGAYYEVRPPGLDGTGDISLRDLVKFVLAIFRFSYLLVVPVRPKSASRPHAVIDRGRRRSIEHCTGREPSGRYAQPHTADRARKTTIRARAKRRAVMPASGSRNAGENNWCGSVHRTVKSAKVRSKPLRLCSVRRGS
jgi:hypothetical protein